MTTRCALVPLLFALGCSAANRSAETTAVNGGLGAIAIGCVAAQVAAGSTEPAAIKDACALDAALSPVIQAEIDSLLAAGKASAAKPAKGCR